MTVSVPVGAPALRALSIGEILDASFTLYRRHFSALATVVVVCSAAPFVLGAYLAALGSPWSAVPLFVAYLLAMIVLGSVAVGATVFIVSESYLGGTLSAGDAFRRAAPRFGALVACSFLLGMVVMVGFLLLFVPGVILACGLMLAIPAVVLEPRITASEALARSWALTRDSKWRMFGLLVTSTVLIYIPAAAIGGIAMFAGAAGWAPAALQNLVQMFLSPFLYCVLTVAYYDLRVRKEGFDLELLAASLQSHDRGSA